MRLGTVGGADIDRVVAAKVFTACAVATEAAAAIRALARASARWWATSIWAVRAVAEPAARAAWWSRAVVGVGTTFVTDGGVAPGGRRYRRRGDQHERHRDDHRRDDHLDGPSEQRGPPTGRRLRGVARPVRAAAVRVRHSRGR